MYASDVESAYNQYMNWGELLTTITKIYTYNNPNQIF